MRGFVAACLLATCALPLGCKKPDPGPDLQIVGESTRVRMEDPVPAKTPWLVDGKVILVGARGEQLGIQVLHRAPGATALAIDGPAQILGYSVDNLHVTRASTDMYGGGRTGTFADGLTPSPEPATNPAYFEVWISWTAVPGVYTGTLSVPGQTLPVQLTVVDTDVQLGDDRVWAYEDPRELAWAGGAPPTAAAQPQPSEEEQRCSTMFAAHGVALAPDLHLDWLDARWLAMKDLRYLPVVIPDDPATVGDAVKAWMDATVNKHVIPFAIPIDEPGTPEARAKVIALGKAIRAAGGGPGKFLFAVTDDPRPEYGDLVDLYISLRTPRSAAGKQWTYNGAPPRAGSMVLDALTPGTRTWGWIGYRWNIPVWYVWDALYWHDRHNRHGAPLPGKPLDVTADPTSFDGGEDHGNLDGVLALPSPRGCRPTLRLEALRRGLEDRALLDRAASCNKAAADALAAKMVPEALGDAPKSGKPSWPTDESAWELARRELLTLAAACTK